MAEVRARGTDFSLGIQSWVEKVRVDVDAVVKDVWFDVIARLVELSPVDTGRFRGNWVAAVGQPNPAADVNWYDKTGAATIVRAAEVLTGASAQSRVFVTNSLPYAWPLEYGHSQQAPSGMVRIVKREFTDIVDRAVADRVAENVRGIVDRRRAA